MSKAVRIFNAVLICLVMVAMVAAGFWINRWLEENRVLRQVIDRLSADSRIAEVLVTKSEYDEETKTIQTTIKFLEYDAKSNALPAQYFTFRGNIIQFQSLVIRFDDSFVKAGDRLRGKSAYLFLKAFVLEGEKTQEFPISKAYQIPAGYKIPREGSQYEDVWWQEFWKYALDPKTREKAGVKNAQIEAPGTMFLPGTIYTLKIEHDGGIRIDAQPIPGILKGENL